MPNRGRNSCYRSADILVRLGLANGGVADKNVRAPFAFLHVVGNCELRFRTDGKPTRWAIYDPEHLNRNPLWWPERGLNSLSLPAYLAAAAHATGDPKYAAASRELIKRQGQAHNAMYPEVQQGGGSGNQSDDEMAF